MTDVGVGGDDFVGGGDDSGTIRKDLAKLLLPQPTRQIVIIGGREGRMNRSVVM